MCGFDKDKMSSRTGEIEANLSPLSRWKQNQRKKRRRRKEKEEKNQDGEAKRPETEIELLSPRADSGPPAGLASLGDSEDTNPTGEMPTFDSLLSLDSDPRTEHLYAIAKRWASGNKITTVSIITFTLVLIASLQEIVTEPRQGPYKKRVLLTVLRKVVDEEKFENEDDKLLLNVMIDSTIPTFIDSAIGIATGQIDLYKLFVSCSPCCTGGKLTTAHAAGEVPR